MDLHFENLGTTPSIEVEPKYTYTTTYDPFTAEFYGSYKVVDRIMNNIRNDLKYQMDIRPYFRIKKVIFNNPATIVYWEDNTKTVVKCGENDTYSEEAGLALCFMKKALGNKGNYNNTFKKYIKENEDE